MQNKKILLENAVGKVLPHDITKIVPGKFKGAAFKKGHIIKKEDIPKLLDLGKKKIWVLEIGKGEYHEDEAGKLFKNLAGENVSSGKPSEGKINFFAGKDGLFVVDRNIVDRINATKDIVFATKHSHIPVKKRENVAGIRIVPLATKKDRVEKVLKIGSKALKVFPFKKKKVAIIVTGSEVASGRIPDKFKPVIEKKIEKFNSTLNFFKIATDNEKLLIRLISKAKKSCDVIILTGGMSVDPDDVTKIAIKKSADVISYGAPVLPGNMFLIAYDGRKVILGVPACAVYFETTVLDLFLPMVFADVKITKKDVLARGYGGFCWNCKPCRYPVCPFGKY